MAFCGCEMEDDSVGEDHYVVGRKTLYQFCNARFQILRTGRLQGLMDVKTNRTLVYPIKKWRKDGYRVYFVGQVDLIDHTEVFVLIDCIFKEATIYKKLDEIPKPERQGFSDLLER
jgi:hypothetical protein